MTKEICHTSDKFKAQSGKQRETVPVKYMVSPLMADILSEGRSYKAF